MAQPKTGNHKKHGSVEHLNGIGGQGRPGAPPNPQGYDEVPNWSLPDRNITGNRQPKKSDGPQQQTLKEKYMQRFNFRDDGEQPNEAYVEEKAKAPEQPGPS